MDESIKCFDEQIVSTRSDLAYDRTELVGDRGLSPGTLGMPTFAGRVPLDGPCDNQPKAAQ